MSVDDRSPKFDLPSAQKELELPLGTPEMGQRVGGVANYANSFKRGYGDRVFGSDDKGIWLGSADFEDAPFSVSMAGLMFFRSLLGNIVIDNANNRIVFYDDNDIPIGVIGYVENGF